MVRGWRLEADLLRLCGGGGLARASLSFLGHGLRGLCEYREEYSQREGTKDEGNHVCLSGLCVFFSSAPPVFFFSIDAICGDA